MRICASRVLFAVVFLFAGAGSLATSPAKPVAVLISGEYEYLSNLTLPTLASYLERHYGFETVYLERTPGNDLPGLEALERADLTIAVIRRMTPPEEQVNAFRQYLASGRPLIGLRTTSHAFENWKSFDAEVLGGNYQGHHGAGPVATVRRAPGTPWHMIFRDLPETFLSAGSLYRNTPLQPGVEVLLSADIPGQPPEPVAWTRRYGDARVFYSSLGDHRDFYEPAFLQMLMNAIVWARGETLPSNAKIPAPLPLPEIRIVDGPLFKALSSQRRFTFIDVRTPAEFALGRIPRAINIPVESEDFAARVAEIGRDQAVVVYCRTGRRSAQAAAAMRSMDFKFLYDYPGGFPEWAADGNPVEK